MKRIKKQQNAGFSRSSKFFHNRLFHLEIGLPFKYYFVFIIFFPCFCRRTNRRLFLPHEMVSLLSIIIFIFQIVFLDFSLF